MSACVTCGHAATEHGVSGYRPCLGTWSDGDCAAMCKAFEQADRS